MEEMIKWLEAQLDDCREAANWWENKAKDQMNVYNHEDAAQSLVISGKYFARCGAYGTALQEARKILFEQAAA